MPTSARTGRITVLGWEAGKTVTIENVNGTITVETWTDSVDATADVEFRGWRGRYVQEVIDETSFKVEKAPPESASGCTGRIPKTARTSGTGCSAADTTSR